MRQASMPMVDYARKRSWNQPVLRDGGGGGKVYWSVKQGESLFRFESMPGRHLMITSPRRRLSFGTEYKHNSTTHRTFVKYYFLNLFMCMLSKIKVLKVVFSSFRCASYCADV